MFKPRQAPPSGPAAPEPPEKPADGRAV
jgi:hypothetical protein